MKAIALLTLFVGFTAADPRTSELATTPSVAAGSDSHSVITEYRLPPNKLEKAKSLYRTQVAMFVVSTIYGLAVIIFVLATRLAPRLRDKAERASQLRFVQAIIFAPLLLLTLDGLSLPVSIYGQYLQRSTYNAYVTGIGASKRVVVWDKHVA